MNSLVRDATEVVSLSDSPKLCLALIWLNGAPNIDRQLLAAKADEIDALVKRLRAVSKGLRHAAVCPAPSHAECPSFQKLLKAAASGALEKRWERTKVRAPRK